MNNRIKQALEQPAPQEPVATLKDEVIGCFNAAFVEGLQEALAETQDEHLKDLVERRLMYALYAAQDTSPPAQRKPCQVWDAKGYDALCQELEGWKARAQRKPLTHEVIDRDFYGRVDFVRLVEAAHGIYAPAELKENA